MKKNKSRDYPLAESPDPGERKPYMTKKQYRAELKQAKREHNIEAAAKGTLGKERAQKAREIAGAIGEVVNTATNVQRLTRGGRGGGRGGGRDFGSMFD
jgi:hypothetical protein